MRVTKRESASETDVVFWAATLRALTAFEDADLAEARKDLYAVELAPRDAFLATGATASSVGLIRQGILRESFTLDDGAERTRGFGLQGDFAGSLSDLLRGGPARTGTFAETETRVVCLPWERLLSLVAARSAWRDLLHAATVRLYLLKAEREYELLALDATERYRRFRERYPKLEAEVSQRHVASYVGVTPEHLSRLRGRLGNLRKP